MRVNFLLENGAGFRQDGNFDGGIVSIQDADKPFAAEFGKKTLYQGFIVGRERGANIGNNALIVGLPGTQENAENIVRCCHGIASHLDYTTGDGETKGGGANVEKESPGAYQRIIFLGSGEAEDAKLQAIIAKIGADDAEFLLRKARANIPLAEMTAGEMVREYLPPVLIALACLLIDRLMIHIFK